MGRVVQFLKQNLLVAAVTLGVATGLVASLVVTVAGNGQSTTQQPVAKIAARQHSSAITYQGQTGQTALALLKKHAKVQTKHYSFGDLVTAINGQAGNGPKYWTLYVNGKMSQVGASTYVTKNSDKIEWRLQ